MGMVAVLEIDHTDDAAERECPMGGGQGRHIEGLAVGRLLAMKRFAIPGGDAAILNAHIQGRGPFRNPRTGTEEQSQTETQHPKQLPAASKRLTKHHTPLVSGERMGEQETGLELSTVYPQYDSTVGPTIPRA